ncbi:MAG: hypothetical protein M3Y27_12100 [Acidobacteriota bacterium]|nr:hypothetical protein [Acidobacteriota bacterium]
MSRKTAETVGGRYIKIPEALFDSVAFRTLPGSAAKLWLDLRTQYWAATTARSC